MNPLDPRTAVYTGTFDPVHYGHLDVVRRGSRLFDRLIVGVGVNPEKAPLFLPAERVDLLRAASVEYADVDVQAFAGLAVRFVRSCGAAVMLRGLRTLSDMEYEFNMSLTNRTLDEAIETVFLMAEPDHSHFTGTLIRQVGVYGGDLAKFLPPAVADAVRRRVGERQAAK